MTSSQNQNPLTEKEIEELWYAAGAAAVASFDADKKGDYPTAALMNGLRIILRRAVPLATSK